MHSLPLLVLCVLFLLPATKPADDIGFPAHLAYHDKPEEPGPEFDLANLPPFLRKMLEKKANSDENAAHLNVEEEEETDKMGNEDEDDWMNEALDFFFSMAETTDTPQKKTVWDGSDEDDFEEMRQYYARKNAKKALDSRDAKETTVHVPVSPTAPASTAYKEAPIKLCGAPLLQYIIDRDLCRPDRCEGVTRPPVLAGWKSRSPSIKSQTGLISEQCCDNHCLPSLISAICCE